MSAPNGAKDRVVEAIITLQADFGFPPTTHEIAAELKVSRTRVTTLLARLRDEGTVDWDKGRARSLRLVRETDR